MKEVRVTAHISAPPSRVFAWVVDPRKPFLTSNPVTSMSITGSQTRGVGTIYQWKFRLPFGLCFRFEEIVTEWVEPERLAYRALSGWDMEALAMFQPDGAGTRETFTLKYRAPAIWSWVLPRWLIALGIRHALVNIQEAATRGASS